ncbi:MAG TPA: nitrilase-related carbon-nitrogen hydrolase [Nitrososphaerales archaeon]|nr:nitrilase-related carbon-nitrogen hydrolase [Nitrososphaerales archaeon]
MGKLKVGIIQMSMQEDNRYNLEKGLRGVRDAAKKGAEVVCLPELFTSRYFPTERQSTAKPEPVPGPTTKAISDEAKASGVIVVGGSVYERSNGKNYNTCLVFDERGKVLSKYRKVHIPQDEHYFEQDYFSSGSKYAVAKTSSGKLGTLICFDQWYPEPARAEKLMGAEALFYPTAIGRVSGIEESEGDWQKAWEAVQVGHAITNSLVICAVNRVGREGRTDFWGGSFVCDQFGKVLFRAGSKEGVYVVDCDLSLGKQVEKGWGFQRNRKPSTYSALGR